MEDLTNELWGERVGEIIIARIKGQPTSDILTVRHERILQVQQESGCKKLLLDDLQMALPTYPQIKFQRKLNPDFSALDFKIAVLVPHSQMAFLARLKFNRENHRVFYNEIADAVAWLAQ